MLSTLNDVRARHLLADMADIGEEILRMRAGGLSASPKTSFQDIVTEADKFSERELVRKISESFLRDGIFGEEGGRKTSDTGYRWFLDPVDGTTNFASGLPFFGISAGREKDGQVDLGALHFPALHQSFFAAKGEGAWFLSGESLKPMCRVKPQNALRESILAVGLTSGNEPLFATFKKLARNVLMFGSFVYEATLVAESQIGACLHTGATQFDVAASSIVAAEAGCIVSGFDGNPIDLRNEKIPIVIAASEAIRDEVLEVCGR